ncbi:MAG: glycerophosphodiester phosphodiesterase [Candidatus Thorarchaeota archaeon]
MRDVLVIGHRGAAAHAPENTLSSFETAWKMGADMVELDIQLTSDGEMVCVHDYDLERVCGVKQLVSETSLEEIRRLDAGDGSRIPLLAEVLDFCRGKIGVNIEIKVPDIEEQALNMVLERDMRDSVMFSSFFQQTLRHLRELDSFIQTGVLYSEPPESPVQYALDFGATSINPLFFTLTPKIVEQAHDAGLKVFPWTVNDEDMILEMLKMGVDGIISDMPDVAARVVDLFLKQKT